MRQILLPNPSPSGPAWESYSIQRNGGEPAAVGSTPICAPWPKPRRYIRPTLVAPSALSLATAMSPSRTRVAQGTPSPGRYMVWATYQCRFRWS